jgi:hypothetical protein
MLYEIVGSAAVLLGLIGFAYFALMRAMIGGER